jgi:hypothetical protein
MDQRFASNNASGCLGPVFYGADLGRGRSQAAAGSLPDDGVDGFQGPILIEDGAIVEESMPEKNNAVLMQKSSSFGALLLRTPLARVLDCAAAR